MAKKFSVNYRVASSHEGDARSAAKQSGFDLFEKYFVRRMDVRPCPDGDSLWDVHIVFEEITGDPPPQPDVVVGG